MADSKTHYYEILIRENHLDTFGHMNNAVFLQIFEQARWDVLTQNGIGLMHIQKIQEGPVVLEIHVQFKREISLRERITVETKILNLNKKIYTLEQKMVDSEKQVRCVAQFTMGYFNMKERKLLTPPVDWLKKLGWDAA